MLSRMFSLGQQSMRFSIALSRLSLFVNNDLSDASTNNNTSITASSVTFSNSSPAQGTHSAVLQSTVGGRAFIEVQNVQANISNSVSICFYLKVTGLVDATAPVYFDIGTSGASRGIYLQRNAAQAFDPTGRTEIMYNICGSDAFALWDNRWMHVAFVISNGSPTVRFYLNGHPQPDITGASAANYPSVTTAIDKVRFGSAIATTDSGLIGLLDDMQLYDRSLSTANVEHILTYMNIGAIGFISDPFVYFKFNDTKEENTGKTYAANNTVLSTTVKKFGTSSLYNPNLSYARYSPSSPIFFPSSGFSFAFWIMLPPTIPSTNARPLFGWGKTHFGDTVFGMTVSETSSPFTLAVKNRLIETKLTGRFLNHSEWYHVVLTLSGAAVAACYVNDTEQMTVPLAQFPIDTDRTYYDMLAQPGNSGPAAYMDEFRYYSRVLTRHDIRQLYNYAY